MPETDILPGFPDAPVATEQELLDFCNRVREAGGTTILDELLPSRPGNAGECLIANALNFGCKVWPDEILEDNLKAGVVRWKWFMYLPGNLSAEQRRAIAEAVGNELVPAGQSGDEKVELPTEIGNAAHAFDKGAAFRDFDRTVVTYA